MPLPPAAEAGVADWPLFIAINCAALLVGFAEVVRDNAAQTMLPALVPHNTLERANSRMWTVEQITNQLIGPVAGAFLIGLFLPAPFLLNAACFALAALMVASLSGSFRPAPRLATKLRLELAEAWRFLVASPLLRTFAITTGVWNMLHQMTLVALVFHAQENLGLSVSAYGVLLTAAAFGGILGGLIAEGVIRRLGAARSAQWMLALSLADFALLAAVPHVAGVALALFIGGVSGIVWDTVSVSNRQRLIPDEMLGRVNSMYRLLAWGMMPVGLLLGGALVRALDGPLDRGFAIMTPFAAAALGLALLLTFQWNAIARGLDLLNSEPPSRSG